MDTLGRTAEARLQNGFHSRPKRVALAAVPGTWVADLQVPWDDFNKQLPLYASGDYIQVDVTFKSLPMCTQSNDVPACTITSAILRLHGQQIINSQQKKLFYELIGSPDPGVDLKITSNQFQNDYIIPAGTTQTALRLWNIKGSVVFLQVGLTPQGYTDTNSTVDLWNYATADSIWLSNNSEYVTDPLELTINNKYAVNDVNFDMFPDCFPNLNLYHIPFCREKYALPSQDHALGSQDFSAYTAAELNFQFNTATTVPLRVHIRALCHNRLQYGRGYVKTLATVQ